MTINKAALDLNELNANAQGGTELMQSWLYERLPDDLKVAFQIISSRVRNLDANKPRLLWLHDLPNDPESKFLAKPENVDLFAKLIFVSQWQMQGYNSLLGVPQAKSALLRNAIDPIPESKKPGGGVKLIYHTTPHRGLNILVPVFDSLCRIHDDIELDVYSSFKLYGWPEQDKPFETLFERCRTHPKIRYHGAVSNAEIRKALQEAHIFAYPSIWQETSCIAGIEALDAKCLMVCPDLAALPETTSGFAMMYPYTTDMNEHARRFAENVNAAINAVKANSDDLQTRLTAQKQHFDTAYGWDMRIQEWTALMRGLLKN